MDTPTEGPALTGAPSPAAVPAPVADTKDTAFEQKKWDDEVRLRSRELDIKNNEVQAAVCTAAQSRWTSPLVVAIFAAALAGLGNAGVAWINGSSSLSLEASKHDEEQTIEETRAEAARILEVVKTGSPDKAAENLGFLLEAGLITNKARSDALTAYIRRRKGGEGISIATNSPVASSTPIQPETTTTRAGPNAGTPPVPTVELIPYESGWLDGGHSQASSCAEGQAKLQPGHPGKTLVLVSSSEQSKKDILGHVTYNYFCNFKVQ